MAGAIADAERVRDTALQTVLDCPEQRELAGQQRGRVLAALVALAAPPQ